MSADRDGGSPPPDGEDPRAKKAGYCNPPPGWKKGQSGNPHGRPKGARNHPKEVSDKSLRAMILEEGRRRMMITDANKPLSIETARAIRRAQGFSALKGSVRAQRDYLDSLRIAENEDKRERGQLLLAIGDYKLRWHEEFERRRRIGIKGKDPLIHPDDFVIDPITQGLRIREPATAEETARWERYRRRCEDRLRELEEQPDHPGRRRKRVQEEMAMLDALLKALGAALDGSREAMLLLEHADLAGMFPEEE